MSYGQRYAPYAPTGDAEVNKREVVNSTRWNEMAVQLAADYDFDYVEGYRTHKGHRPVTVANQRLKSVDHCEFCGQLIVYVAVIGGKSKFAPETSKIPLLKQIGFDCLERILGVNLGYYHKAMQDYKEMKNDAAIESRQKRYAEKYKDYIDWLLNLSPMLIENKSYNYQNGFLRDMLHLLTTGQKQFTKDQEAYLQRVMKDPRFDTKNAVEITQIQRNELKKIKELLAFIAKVDGKKIVDSYRSSYSVVNNILAYVVRNNGATQAMLLKLNDINKTYVEREKNQKITPVKSSYTDAASSILYQ